jgi:hypothetical protein
VGSRERGGRERVSALLFDRLELEMGILVHKKNLMEEPNDMNCSVIPGKKITLDVKLGRIFSRAK